MFKQSSADGVIGILKPGLAALRAAFVAVTLAALPAVAADPLAEGSVKSYNLQAGPLGRSLSGFAASSGVPLSFDPRLTEGLNAPALGGNYSAQEGFARLLSKAAWKCSARLMAVTVCAVSLPRAPCCPR